MRTTFFLAAFASLLPWGAGCSQTPPEIPVRSLERSERMVFVCLHVTDQFGTAVAPEVRPEKDCTVSPVSTPEVLPNRLFALVTQTARGEVGVVDLTGRKVVDVDYGTPGINLLPVGNMPADIALAPKGDAAFVVTAEPNKFAMYLLPTKEVLGSSGFTVVPTLASWPACPLPARPTSAFTIARQDGSYDVGVVTAGTRTNAAKIVFFDPAPLLRGAALDSSAGPTIDRGTFGSCVVRSAIELKTWAQDPTAAPGTRWPSGLPYVADAKDGPMPLDTAKCDTTDAGAVDANVDPDASTDAGPADADAGVIAGDAGDVGDAGDAGAPDASTVVEEGTGPKPVRTLLVDTYLYVTDDALPIVHILDLAAGKEIAPLQMSSILAPNAPHFGSNLAVSPRLLDGKRNLYVVDRTDGTIAVFDVTDPATSARTPLTRPYPASDPFQPPDRIAFGVPVGSVTFAQHDVAPIADTPVTSSPVLCNPNRNVSATDPAGRFRANGSGPVSTVGPTRLRGTFAFATLANGQVVTLDVEDWDAACRRPLSVSSPRASDVSIEQPGNAGGSDRDPFHEPLAPAGTVTEEAFFPVSSPHRPRSAGLLNDIRIPRLVSRPGGFLGNAPLATSGDDAAKTPLLLPTSTNLVDPILGTAPQLTDPRSAVPGVRVSYEIPELHVDQDWNVTFEGVLPGMNGIITTMASSDDFQSINLSQREAFFCKRGIEDARVSQSRRDAIASSLASGGFEPVPDAVARIGDYVQIADELLPASDPYWSLPNACWDGDLASNSKAKERADFCAQTFGTKDEPRLERDFPIAEAYDNRLVVTRFGYPNGTRNVTTRAIVGKDVSNRTALRAADCCFHHQVTFNVRAGGQWLTQGSVAGYLHNIARGEGGACVRTCDPREALLNSRSVTVPRPTTANASFVAPDRNSPLSLRNPFFSFVIYSGVNKGSIVAPERDTVWKFQTTGQFSALAVSLTPRDLLVSLQGLAFAAPLGQVVVLDGAGQGITLLSLETMQIVDGTPLL